MMLLAFFGLAQARDSANALFKAARKAEKNGDVLHAYVYYAKAAKLAPKNIRYAAAKQALQIRASLPEVTVPKPDVVESPGLPANAVDLARFGQISPSELAEAIRAAPIPRLAGKPGIKDFDLRGDAKNVIEKVAAEFGLVALFGPDYQNPPPVRLRVEGMEWETSLRLLEDTTNSFFVPLDAKTFLVERETPQRRADTSATMSIAIPIPERLSVQEAQELVTAAQQILEIRRIGVDPGRHLIVMRDNASKVKAAQALFAELSRGRAQVSVDIDFLSASKTSSLHYGLTTPTSSPIVSFGKVLRNTVGSTAGFTRFLTFGGGASFIGFGVADAQMFANVANASSATMFHAQVTSVDGQAATMHVGDRYPIIVNGYYGNTTGTGAVYTPPPTVNFQDLGLVLKVTPTVHEGGEVTIEIESEYNVLGAATSNNIPIISHRKYTGKVRLVNGEAAVLAGMFTKTVSQNRRGLAGLERLPLIGRFFRSNAVDKEDTEILLTLRPHVTNEGPFETPVPTLWVGTDSRPLTLY
jgi:hypothetical protein